MDYYLYMNHVLSADPHCVFPERLRFMPCNFRILPIMECHRQYGYFRVQFDYLKDTSVERQLLGNAAGRALREDDENTI